MQFPQEILLLRNLYYNLLNPQNMFIILKLSNIQLLTSPNPSCPGLSGSEGGAYCKALPFGEVATPCVLGGVKESVLFSKLHFSCSEALLRIELSANSPPVEGCPKGGVVNINIMDCKKIQ